jgi:hypothetical protein
MMKAVDSNLLKKGPTLIALQGLIIIFVVLFHREQRSNCAQATSN